MIERYTRPEMGKVWSEENKFQKMLEIELLVCEALAGLGEIPREALAKIKDKAGFDLKRIQEIEGEVHHDVIAFLTAVAEQVGEESRYIHLGLTSYDVVDTALSLRMREAADLILQGLKELAEVLKGKAREHEKTAMVGRSHGIHAGPITFGLKLALWWKEVERNRERIEEARHLIGYGKISGAVGTYAHIDPGVEEYVCEKLNLTPAPVSSQILQRDRHAHYLSVLALLASSLEKFALEIRNLQRTELLEVEEYFSPGQKGSSAMPHKRNPIISERISGLARVVRGNALAALEDVPLWHERDLTHSSVERIIIPDSCILVDYMLKKFIAVMKGLIVYPENMKRNLEKTRGLIFSETVLLELAKKGLSREEAYRLVQRNAMKAWDKETSFKELLLQDEELGKYLHKDEVERCFDLKHNLRNVKKIFERLGI
ncbi:adenylosuccinate lyase [candidate division NPL-UPA2 bacterium]|nr:adenylosuccinate lyase [candidate division NPL-UPA2 bacterium]